jgi:hemoglobin
MSELRDIENRDDIVQLVTAFYGTLFDDPVLGPIFRDVAKVNLDRHIPTFADFWENLLFQTGAYRGGLMAAHIRVHLLERLSTHHLQRWLDTWETTIDEQFAGPRANHAKVQASRVGVNMFQRLAMFDQQQPLMAADNLPRGVAPGRR